MEEILSLDNFNETDPCAIAAEATVIKIKPIYEIAGNGCQCLGFMQYKLNGFDNASYMEMLSDPATMQAIKEIYYTPKPISDEPMIVETTEIPLEY